MNLPAGSHESVTGHAVKARDSFGASVPEQQHDLGFENRILCLRGGATGKVIGTEENEGPVVGITTYRRRTQHAGWPSA